MTSPAVLTEGIVRTFDEVRAVDGVDLEVQRGEIYGFLGPNGAGKSTLVRMLCTLLVPTAGRAMVAGHDVVAEAERVRLSIGLALQEAALDDKQTGRELLRLQARLYGLRPAEVRQRVDQVIELVDIGDAIDRRIGTYSGGMKRRLDLAAALVHNPEVLFLDEPTTGLDPASRLLVWREIRRLNTELEMTIFLTTQYLEEADELAHRVGIIDHGKLVAEGSPDALKRSIGSDVIVAKVDGQAVECAGGLRDLPGIDQVDVHHDEVVVRTADGAAAISGVAVALNQMGVSVRNLTLRTPTLDDVFLELTGAHIESGDGSAVVKEEEEVPA
ncbi:MAG: ATP-binding cassette domain-containing protein [Acidimicrobiales bacterium]